MCSHVEQTSTVLFLDPWHICRNWTTQINSTVLQCLSCMCNRWFSQLNCTFVEIPWLFSFVNEKFKSQLDDQIILLTPILYKYISHHNSFKRTADLGASDRKKGNSLVLKKRGKMAVKLFGPAYASCSRRVLACLIEKDIQFEIVPVDIFKGEQKKPEFLALQVGHLT